jgi:hypothetical protein
MKKENHAMKKEFFITEFWAGPDGHRQLWHSETTEADPTRAIREVMPGQFASLQTGPLLIITFPVRHWTKPCNPNKDKL